MPADAPVISVTGRRSVMRASRSCAFAATRWRNAIRASRGNVQQVGGAPDQIVLELGDAAVGIDDLPHHLDDLLAAASSSERLSRLVKR